MNGVGASSAFDRSICTCRYRRNSESGEREREHTCQKCINDLDNLKTKSKMNQIRLVMQQSKQKREARKLKGLPYGNRLVNGVATSTTTKATNDLSPKDTEMLTTPNPADQTTSQALNNATAATTLAATTTAATTEVSANHIVEEVDTAA